MELHNQGRDADAFEELKLELNDQQSLKDLVQEAYRISDEQIVQAQNEINKLSNATQLSEETIIIIRTMAVKTSFGSIAL